ncbi:MAG: GTP pyrophosphokinase family protein [Burkholderiaceae bacterium]
MKEPDFLARWTAEKGIYAAWGDVIAKQVLEGLRALDSTIDPEVFVKIPPRPRLKGDDSLLGKAFHRSKAYADPYAEIEDKIGVRFVVLLASDVLTLQSVIEGGQLWNWSLDKDYEQDRAQRPLEFAYQSKHYVLRAKQNLTYSGVTIPSQTPCEVQLRTLLQHAHSELTHDNIYKAQSGTLVTSTVHRTVAKSMALIEAVDDFFELAIQQLGDATAAERAAMKSLSQLFERFVGLAPGSDKSNAIVLHAFRQQIAPNLHSQIEAMLKAKPFILDKIKARYGSIHAFRQPWILFAYLQVDSQPNQTQKNWPLTPSEISMVYTDLGSRMN